MIYNLALGVFEDSAGRFYFPTDRNFGIPKGFKPVGIVCSRGRIEMYVLEQL